MTLMTISEKDLKYSHMQRRNYNLQTFQMESLATILDGLQLTIIVAKLFTLDVSGDPGYAS